MDADLGAARKAIKVGQRVRIRQPICTGRNTRWRTDVTGTVIDVDLADTGAWYAHCITGHLQLVRIRVRKDNGEVSELNLDPLTRIEHVNSIT
jgi:hypothetical protein